MKRFLVLLFILSVMGTTVAAILLYQHYFPSSTISAIACGSGLVNPCVVLSRSGYATFLGLPIAGYGLIAYLFMCITIGIALFVKDSARVHVFGIILPIIAASILVDIILGSILIHLSITCRLCIASGIINILMAATLFSWYLEIHQEGEGLREIYRKLHAYLKQPSNRPLIVSSAIGVLFMLFFIVVLSAFMRTSGSGETTERIIQFETYYRNLPREELVLPESIMTIGSPSAPITIVVFTDVTCTACYRFYEVEKSLLARFWGKIRIVYFHFPLDTVCNPHTPHTSYPNSCVASQCFFAAARLGMFREYLEFHFEHYLAHKPRLQSGDVLVSVREFFKDRSTPDEYRQFIAETMSESSKLALNRDIELGGSLSIKAVPTLFINGKRLEGVPDADLLEAVIDRELQAE